MSVNNLRFGQGVAAIVCGAVLMFTALSAQAVDLTKLKHIVVAEATSQVLLRSREIDFAASFALADDMTADLVSFDEALDPTLSASSASSEPSAPSPQPPRYAVVIDVFLAKSSRRVLNLLGVGSTVFLGFQGASFAVAADDPARSASGFASFSANVASPSPYGGTTTQAVGQPIILNYSYDQAQIQSRRKLSAHIYLIDRVAKTFIRSTVDIAEDKRFDVAYRVSRYDPRAKSIKRDSNTEKDVDEYEKRELLINLSDVLKDFQAKLTEAKPFTSALALNSEIRSAQTQVLANLEANRFDARPLNDPRFDSVVVVYTGPGALGSGFYITPNVVMTNWHVVNGHRIVEMKAYDGQQTYGTVMGHDARLDIALVKVQRRGRPVAFYTGRNLNLGATVEAIGHPLRHEFSITRGVVSAIRKHFSINLPRWSGGEDVLFVQTDAPINPGNSGGPLFLGERVIGMNTWGNSNSDGLSFSIHYSELLNFVNEHLPGFKVDPAGRG